MIHQYTNNLMKNMQEKYSNLKNNLIDLLSKTKLEKFNDINNQSISYQDSIIELIILMILLIIGIIIIINYN